MSAEDNKALIRRYVEETVQQRHRFIVGLARALLAVLVTVGITACPLSVHGTTTPAFFSSIDTMKESMDTVSNQLADAQIAADVNLAATLNTTHITVDTFYDYPDYMLSWINAVRATGKHVWLRTHFCAWEGNCGLAATMTPSDYLTQEQTFISNHPTFLQPGDIFDPNPEPENSPYWVNTYGSNWSWQGAPNAATDDYNNFILATTTTADNALHQLGIYGVTTSIRSVNSWFGAHPSSLYQSTLTQLGHITIDSFPEGTTTDPATAADARAGELNNIESIRGVPIVIGEMGYSNDVNVDDATQEAVLKAEFNSLQTLNYLAGVNYWVGAGTSNSGGYTHVFAGTTGAWTLRPAAGDLSSFYATELQGTAVPPTASPTPTAANTATALPPTASPTPTAANTATAAPPTASPTPTAKSVDRTASPTPTATAVRGTVSPTPTAKGRHR